MFSVCFKASEAYLSTFGGPPGTVWAASMVTIHVYSQTVRDISRHVFLKQTENRQGYSLYNCLFKYSEILRT